MKTKLAVCVCVERWLCVHALRWLCVLQTFTYSILFAQVSSSILEYFSIPRRSGTFNRHLSLSITQNI